MCLPFIFLLHTQTPDNCPSDTFGLLFLLGTHLQKAPLLHPVFEYPRQTASISSLQQHPPPFFLFTFGLLMLILMSFSVWPDACALGQELWPIWP